MSVRPSGGPGLGYVEPCYAVQRLEVATLSELDDVPSFRGRRKPRFLITHNEHTLLGGTD